MPQGQAVSTSASLPRARQIAAERCIGSETRRGAVVTFARVPADPLLSLASSIHPGPGTYALLLGSGVSVAAGVPSGWDVTLRLIERYAVLRGEDCSGDQIAWFRRHSGGDPDYSTLLEYLAPSPEDRRSLLAEYFEPSEEDREQGLKTPTAAHRAIAGLVADGFIRVIVTTNFDRLLESALSEAGVEPSVISSPQHASGALPLTHSRCTVVKVHGDYLSPNLKNTVAELDSYDSAIDRLLDQVFDEYGTVVCGWSAEWDTALRNAILRSRNRRFSTFWMHRSSLGERAQELVGHRSAVTVPITTSDASFDSLAAAVTALSDVADREPQDTAIAVARLKRYLPDPIHRIRLEDLINDETEALIEQVAGLPVTNVDLADTYRTRMRAYETASARLIRLLAVAAFFSDRHEHTRLWQRCIDRLANRATEDSGLVALIRMQQYPTLLALYAMAIGAVAANRSDHIAQVLGTVRIRSERRPEMFAAKVSSWHVLDHDCVKNAIPELQKRKTPISDHLLDVLRPATADIITDETQLQDMFDEAEYLLALASTARSGAGPAGRAGWRRDIELDPLGGFVNRHKSNLIEAGVFDDDAHLESCRQHQNKRLEQVWW